MHWPEGLADEKYPSSIFSFPATNAAQWVSQPTIHQQRSLSGVRLGQQAGAILMRIGNLPASGTPRLELMREAWSTLASVLARPHSTNRVAELPDMTTPTLVLNGSRRLAKLPNDVRRVPLCVRSVEPAETKCRLNTIDHSDQSKGAKTRPSIRRETSTDRVHRSCNVCGNVCVVGVLANVALRFGV